MAASVNQDSNNNHSQLVASSRRSLQKVVLWTATGTLITVAFLASGGWVLVFWALMYASTGGWNSLSINPNALTQTEHNLTAGDRTVNVLLSDYDKSKEYGEVTVQISVSGEFSGTQVSTSFPTLTSDYDHDWRQFGEAEPGYYKLKDIDGDWKKDFLIQVGSRMTADYYYISSRDGRGFRTDENFKNAQPWPASSDR